MKTHISTLTFAVLSAPLLVFGQAIITTVAGTGTSGFSGDGGPAVSARISSGGSFAVATDSAGNFYIVDGGNNRIRKVNSAGIISTVAGGGGGFGDGVLATKAMVFPSSVAVDAAGNLYIAQGASIRKVDTAGIITTIAGGIVPGFSGDGGPATSAQIFATNATADAAGNVYIAEATNQRIRKIDTAGIIRTIAGTGVQGYSGDGGPATSAKLQLPQGPAVDSAGNVYFAEVGRIRKVDTEGIITTVAGNGSAIASGDGGPAIRAGMAPIWVAVDGEGNLYIADNGNGRIRKVNTSGIISTLAGGALNTGTGIGDGGPATSAVLSPVSVAVDPQGNVYIADKNNVRVRKVSSGASGSPISVNPASLSFSYTIGSPAPPSQTAVIFALGATLTFTAAASTTSGGNWLSVSPASGNVNATLTISVDPQGLAPGTYNGTVTLTPSGAGNTPQTIPVLLNVNAPVAQGVISTVAGNGLVPFQGEGGAAINAGLGVNALALDNTGNIFIGDTVSNKVLKVNSAGVITAFAGNGSYTFVGDGGPATGASVFGPNSVAADRAGNVYIADTTNNRIRKVDSSGTISTIAGTGAPSSSGDGGAASRAAIMSPLGIAVDGSGNLYLTDGFRIRKVNAAGIISNVAGQFLPGFSGDGGQATSATFLLIGGVTVDGAGNLYIADIGNNRIRKVNTSGVVSTVAGSGTKGYSGDGGPAIAAAFNLSAAHLGLAVDGSGNLYIPDTGNNRVRRVDSSGVVTTVAGNGIGGFSGDGGPGATAGLSKPADVAVDSAGNLYIADAGNNRVRKLTFAAASGGPVISTNGVVNGASYQPGFAANAWTTIVGRNLASGVATWDNFIVNGKLPTSLGGVSVTIGGQPAYLYYVSPEQINLIAPPVPSGSSQVVVTNSSGSSSTVTATVSQYGPAFFPWPLNQVVATRQDFSFAAKDGTFPGVKTTPARPGDVVILYGSGFGPTSPAAPGGVQLPADRTYSTATAPTVTINGVNAVVYGAALAPGFAGLYQIAIQVPSSLGDGDWPIQATIGGAASPLGPVLSVKR